MQCNKLREQTTTSSQRVWPRQLSGAEHELGSGV
jgi:hypothetical protein